MAGSWQHMTTREGKLLNNENFCGMIENLGDAYEAAEECFGMIWWLARAFEEASEWGSEQATREKILETIRRAQAHYRNGLEEGGVQRS